MWIGISMQKCCSSPQRVVSHLPNIATLRRGTPRTDVWSWRPRLPALNEVLSPVLPLTAGQHVLFHVLFSATIFIFFTRLVHFEGGEERGVVKKSTLCTLVMMMKKMDGPLVAHPQPADAADPGLHQNVPCLKISNYCFFSGPPI
jgi:hypothetical protein